MSISPVVMLFGENQLLLFFEGELSSILSHVQFVAADCERYRTLPLKTVSFSYS